MFIPVSSEIKTPSRKASFWILYAGFLLSVVIGIGLLGEICVRLFIPRSAWTFSVAKDDWQPDLEIGWVNKSNRDITSRDDGPEIRFQLNPDGLQPASTTEAKRQGSKRVMIFGDSCTVGRAVPEDERLAQHLKRQLTSDFPDLEVICAGVQGYSTDQSLILMKRLLPRYRPDVVIHMVCDNDFGGNESSIAYGLSKPMFTLNQDQSVQLIPPTKEAIDKTWNVGWGSGWKYYLQHSALYRIVRPAIFRLRFGTETDWRQSNMLGGATPQAQIEMLSKANWRLFAALIQEMDETCRKNGAMLILSQHPHSWEVWDQSSTEEQSFWLHRKLQSVADAYNVRFCGVVPFFMQHNREGPFHLVPRDPHCNGKGYEMTARCYADYLRSTRTFAPNLSQP